MTIPANAASATITIAAVENTAVDGNQTITITAAATDFQNGTASITVTDNDTAALTLTPSVTQIFEDTGSPTTTGNANSFTVTVERNGDTTAALPVTLSTSNSGAITVPGSVTIPAGATSAQATIQTIPNVQVNTGNTLVTITATASGFPTQQTQVTLVDTDAPTLLVGFSESSVSENPDDPTGTVTYTVTRNTDTTSALSVNIAASPAGLVSLSSPTLTIPVGAASGSITVSGVNNNLVNNPRSVALTATATGFAAGAETVIVTDDDTPQLSIALPNGSTVAENAAAGSFTATVIRNDPDSTSDLTATLTYVGDSRLTGPATVTIPAGQTSATITLQTIDNNIAEATNGTNTISAIATGYSTGTAAVTITNDDLATMTLTPAAFDVNETAGVGGATLTLTRDSSDTAETVTIAYSDTSLLNGDTSVSFAAGETQKLVTVNVINNSSFLENPDVTVTASSPIRSTVTATIGIINDDVLTLTTDTSSNVAVPSVEALVTKDNTFTITGQTAPGITVQIESTGNNAFDDHITVADSSGHYSIDVPLTHTTANGGDNQILVRAVSPTESVEKISNPINVHLAVAPVVRFQTNQDLNNDGTDDFYDIELVATSTDRATEKTLVDNFMSYVADGSYNGTIIHRAPTGFVIQGGSFLPLAAGSNSLTEIASKGTVTDANTSPNSNIRGSLAVAHAGGNAATGGWFINTVDNSSNLDAAGHGVLGNVIAGGMTVVDAIQNLQKIDLQAIVGASAVFSTFPVNPNLRTPFTGSVSITTDSAIVTGTGTKFTTEFHVGDIAQISGTQLIVVSIESDTQMTVDVQASTTTSGLTGDVVHRPTEDEFVVFSNIGEILNSI
ncbi:MAG: peptidylprolyl isomerase [Planctomycetaceae bacterium]